MDELKRMKQSLISCVSSQIHGNLHQANAEQLGQAVDMIKDLAQAIYYCTVTEAMEKTEEQEKYYSPYRYDDMPRMYYTPGQRPHNRDYDDRSDNRRMTDSSRNMGSWARDYRQGQSPTQRKNYMQGKQMHRDKAMQVKQLENYMGSLSKDITQMIQDASQEEKDVLKQKLNTLVKMIV